ncbi:MAG TPA: hypothetical protein VH500_24980 [Nitrososphaeraceae archaeon]
MNNKTGFAIAAVAIFAALLITTTAASNAFAGGHYKKSPSQTSFQRNECGNGYWPLKVDCQNAASQIQGRDNAAAVAASQGSGFSGHKDGGKGGYDDGGKGGYDDGGSAHGGKGGDANSGSAHSGKGGDANSPDDAKISVN